MPDLIYDALRSTFIDFENILTVCFAVGEKCKKLLPPDNGFIEKSNTTVGGVTVFRCNDTFTIDGTAELICKHDGEYSKDRPTCKKG